MTSFIEKKREQNKKSGNVPIKTDKTVVSCSQHKPDAPAYGTTPTLVRMNDYHKDLVKFTAAKLGMSGAEFIRLAIRHYAEKHGVA